MTHATIDIQIQADRLWPGTSLATSGNGRHRGRRADDDQRLPGKEMPVGLGRHRKIPRTPPMWATEDTDSQWA